MSSLYMSKREHYGCNTKLWTDRNYRYMRSERVKVSRKSSIYPAGYASVPVEGLHANVALLVAVKPRTLSNVT